MGGFDLLDAFDAEAFAELPVTFAQKKNVCLRALGDAPWSAAHDLGYIYYYPDRYSQAHITLRHHLIGFEFEPGVVRVQLDTGPMLDRILKARSFYFVPAGSTVEVRKEHMCENLLITLDPKACEGIVPGLSGICMTDNMECDDVSQRAFDFRRQLLAGKHQPEAVRSLVDTALAALKVRFSAPARDPAPLVISSMRIKRALDYIDENYATKVSVEEIASAAGGISAFHFAHVFRSALGRAPYQCVVERKLYQARSLLTETPEGIAKIAYVAGFASQAHMTETFSRRIGVTPSQFRRMSRTFLRKAPASTSEVRT
jgi:AraC family transcriptional regulator